MIKYSVEILTLLLMLRNVFHNDGSIFQMMILPFSLEPSSEPLLLLLGEAVAFRLSFIFDAVAKLHDSFSKFVVKEEACEI